MWKTNKLCRWGSGAFDSFDEDLWSVRDGLTFSQNIYLAPQSMSYNGFDIISFNKSMLQNGCYITGIYNEYYIPGKKAYNKFNFNHDYVIFGYDDINRTFKSATYLRNKTYGYFDIAYDDYLSGVIKNDISKTNLNYYKINTDFIPRIDISSIKSKLEDYLFFRRNVNCTVTNEIFGIDVWLELAKYVELAEESLDFRFGRVCMEHHGAMLKRIHTLLKYGHLENYTIAKEYEEIYLKTKTIHKLFIKYNVSKNRELLKKVASLLVTVSMMKDE